MSLYVSLIFFIVIYVCYFFFFFFNDTATTEIYTLSLHDALPIYGARRASAGTVQVGGRRLRAGDVTAAVRAGIGLAPEERKAQGLLLDEPVYRNITLSTFGRFSKGGLLDERTERRIAEEQAEALDLRPAGVDRAIRTLSGGNQQKAMLARWLVHGCRVLLLDEPTRGVDVGARAEIYALVRRLADEGAAVVVV